MKENLKKEIHNSIIDYYTNKIQIHGAIPEGVDWNSEESQIFRFMQLSKIIDKDNFSINDIGYGYGKYYEFFNQNFKNFSYYGYDLSSKMIEIAKKLYATANFEIITDLNSIKEQDFSIASGIFNVKMKYTEAQRL